MGLVNFTKFDNDYARKQELENIPKDLSTVDKARLGELKEAWKTKYNTERKSTDFDEDNWLALGQASFEGKLSNDHLNRLAGKFDEDANYNKAVDLMYELIRIYHEVYRRKNAG